MTVIQQMVMAEAARVQSSLAGLAQVHQVFAANEATLKSSQMNAEMMVILSMVMAETAHESSSLAGPELDLQASVHVRPPATVQMVLFLAMNNAMTATRLLAMAAHQRVKSSLDMSEKTCHRTEYLSLSLAVLQQLSAKQRYIRSLSTCLHR